MALDSREDFFGCKLSKDNKEHVWSAPEDTELDIEHKLQITQACLGVDAKQGERNVVDVTTEDESGEQVTHTILSLQLGQNDMARVELGLLSKSTFKLVQGNGPVHLTGIHMQAAFAGDSDEDDDDDESDEDVPDLVKPADNKEVKNAKTTAKEEKPAVKAEKPKIEEVKQAKPVEPKKPAAKPQPVTKAAKVEEDSEDSDEDEEEEKEEAKGNKLVDDEASDDDEEMDSEDEDESDDDLDDEDDDDDDDLDDDDDDEDDDMSDEDESEDEEEIAPPKAKKSKIVVNGHGKDNKTPNKKADNKPQEKTPAKVPDAKDKTPKSNKKGEIKTPKGAKTPATPNLEEVKKKLLKSPNLPKTAEKFKNFMKSAHRVTDDDTVKGLWDWVQKSKK